MKLFPAIDLYKGCAVRLFKGDYDQMTVYSDNPAEFAAQFEAKGAENLYEAIQAFLLVWQTMCLEQTPNPFAFSALLLQELS